jgi:aromatic ring hydroxylase
MPARTGQQYIESLRRMRPCIYLNGRRVAAQYPEATQPRRTRR